MLNDEQIEEIRQFCGSPTCVLLFDGIEASIMAKWIIAKTPADREECWQELQACLRLQAALRDAGAMKRLTQRSQGKPYTT
jgi:hypothetical protein